MKLLFTLVTLLLSYYNVNSQTNSIKYDTCHNLQQYQGEWMYVNGYDTIKIYFRYHWDYNESLNSVTDNLYGWHEYKRGNSIVESNYQYRFMILPYNSSSDSLDLRNHSILLSLNKCDNLSLFTGSIRDLNQSNELKSVRASISGNSTILNWEQRHMEGYGAFTGSYGMTLPKQFTLIKQ